MKKYMAIINNHLMLTFRAETTEDAAETIRNANNFVKDLKIFDKDLAIGFDVADLLVYETVSIGELIDMGNAIDESYAAYYAEKAELDRLVALQRQQFVTPGLQAVISKTQQLFETTERIYYANCACMGVSIEAAEGRIQHE